MRSRYTAYVVGDVDYLIATHAITGTHDRAALATYVADTMWRGLEIVGTEGDEAAGGRERWRHYKVQGLQIKHHGGAESARG